VSADIFISHSSRDRDMAQTLCDALEARGFGCWMAERDVGPGENFQVAIYRAIRTAKAMVLVFSGHANNSDEIKKELVLASQSRLVVIPVRIEDVVPDEGFAYELAIRQWIDLFADWEGALQRLARQLEGITGVERDLSPDRPLKDKPLRPARIFIARIMSAAAPIAATSSMDQVFGSLGWPSRPRSSA
jgi:hypothetical protein